MLTNKGLLYHRGGPCGKVTCLRNLGPRGEKTQVVTEKMKTRGKEAEEGRRVQDFLRQKNYCFPPRDRTLPLQKLNGREEDGIELRKGDQDPRAQKPERTCILNECT